MRQIRQATGGILALIRTLAGFPVLVLPPALISVWVYSYFRDCYELMLAPGVPIEYKYSAQTGIFSAKAESYRIEVTRLWPFDGHVRLTNVAWGPDQAGPLAEVGAVEVRLDRKVVTVVARRNRLTVERGRGGFSFLQGLPKSEGPPSTTPFRVRLSDTTVEYVDQTQTPWLRDEAVAADAVIEGMGQDVTATTNIRLASVGPLLAVVKILDGHTKIDLAGKNVDLMPALRHARRWTDTSIPLQAQSIRGNVVTSVSVPPKGAIRIAGKFDGKVTQASWPDIVSRANATTTIDFDERSAIVRFSGNDQGVNVLGRGRVSWDPDVRLAMDLDATAASSRNLPRAIARSLQGASFSGGRYKGLVTYAGKQFGAFGRVDAGQILAAGQSLTNVSGDVAYSGDQVEVRRSTGRWQGSAFQASVSVNFKTQVLSGLVTAAGFEASTLNRYVRGRVNGQAILAGTLKRPTATVDLASDDLAFRDNQGRTLIRGKTDSRLQVTDDNLTIVKAVVNGPDGIGLMQGRANLRSGEISATVKAGNLTIKKWLPEFGGVGFASGTLTGQLSKPVFKGKAEAYGVTAFGRSVPAIRAQLVADADGILAQQLRIDQGSASITGQLAWTSQGGSIRGKLNATNIQLSDWTEDAVRGVASVSDISVSGTVNNPVATGNFSGQNLLAVQTEINAANGRFQLQGKRVTIPNFMLEVGDGRASGNLVYNYGEEFIRANALLTNVQLNQLLAGSAPVPVAGAVNGSVSIFGPIAAVRGGAGDLRVDGLAVSGYAVGNGTATAKFEGGIWTGRLEVGEQDRFVIADKITYDPRTKQIVAIADALNVDLTAIGRAVVANTKKLDPEIATTLQTLAGNVSFSAEVQGDVASPKVSLRDFVADDLVIHDVKAGKIEAEASVLNKQWQLPKFLWTRDEGTMLARGTGDADGIAGATLEVEGFRSEWLAEIIPGFPVVAGDLKLDFDLAGKWDSLAGRGNAAITDIGPSASAAKPNINIFDLTLANNTVSAEALFSAEGFSGSANLRAPLAALGIGEGTDKSVAANVILVDRAIGELLPDTGIVDKARTSGTLGGSLNIAGEVGDLKLTGGVRAKGTSLGLRKTNPRTKVLEPLATTLKDFDLNFALRDNKLVLEDGRIGVNENGTVVANLSADLKSALSGGADSVEEFLDLVQVYGGIAISNVLINEKVTAANAPLVVGVDGDIVISGNLRTPEITTPNPGGIRLSKLDLPTPDESEPREASELLIDPIFRNIGLTIVGEARVRAAATNLWLVGGGQISGSLTYPNVAINTRLTKGIFELPNARINVEPGSPINFSYQATPFSEPFARLDLDLEGRTSISAKKTTDAIERYEIELRIRGNLLDPEGVKISARSDPPDLSEQQILAILGQQELIEQLASVAVNQPGANRNQFREAVFGLALPTLSSGLTRSLAQSFGLDYLTLEYNAFDGATLAAGKTIARGLTVTARRQISQVSLDPPKYELKLSYRIPGRAGFFQRSRLGFGFTNEVPWRITFDYTIRR